VQEGKRDGKTSSEDSRRERDEARKEDVLNFEELKLELAIVFSS